MDSPSTTQPAGSELLHDIITPRQIKNVVPIISNSFYINEVLCNETKITKLIADKTDEKVQDLTVDEWLTKLWSGDINYFMDDDHNLARVAQYYQVQKRTSNLAKEAYLEFLNSTLLDINPEKKKLFPQLNTSSRFSEIVTLLGYTKSLGSNDPLDKLANVQFSNYITTSYHDFMERALIKAERKPITQFLFLDSAGAEITAPILDDTGKISDPIENLEGTESSPVVYHLFGLENYPESLVISEDDYVNFLVAAVTDTDTNHPMLPMGLRKILSANHLLLLGYQLQDWDFRVLFRLILHLRNRSPKPGIFMQIPPKREVKNLLNHLMKYFNPKEFDVEWKSPTEFTQELWKMWERK
jgi:hypothetical protein